VATSGAKAPLFSIAYVRAEALTHNSRIATYFRDRTLVAAHSFQDLKEKIFLDPIRELQSFPYIGPITAFHIAKNIGIRVAKPDTHLVRLARSNGFESVQEFCETIATFLGEDIRLVDSVLWRFATMHDDYALKFSRLMVG